MPQLRMAPAYTTSMGRAYHADAIDVLRSLADDSVSLVFTSPPFALRRKKAYGNVSATEYVEWFWPFAEQIHRILRPDGSFVFDLGGAWNPGSGTRSLFPYELILRLGELSLQLVIRVLLAAQAALEDVQLTGACAAGGECRQKRHSEQALSQP